jgi:hypothetical protein
LKIIIKTPQSHAAGQDDTVDEGSNGDEIAADFTPLLKEQGFTEKELAMPFERLHALCRSQVKWVEKEGEQLQKECQKWEELYKREWIEKEVLRDQIIQSELDWHKLRQAVSAKAVGVQAQEKVSNGDGKERSTGNPITANGAKDRDINLK